MSKLPILAVFLMLGPGCSTTDPLGVMAEAGNEALGIAEFQTTETPSQVVIVALDAAKQEVGRIEATAGRFVRTQPFGRPGEVDGHKLTIEYKGVKQEHQSQGVYQSEGVLGAITLPRIFGGARYAPLDAFVRDPHVRPVLAKYGIGFEGEAPVGTQNGEEVAYDDHQYNTCYGDGAYDGTTDPSADTCNQAASARQGRFPLANILAVAHVHENVFPGRDQIVFTCSGGTIATSHGFARWGEAKDCCNPRTPNCVIANTGLTGGQSGCAILWGPEETNGDVSVSFAAPSDYPTCSGSFACSPLDPPHCAVLENVHVDAMAPADQSGLYQGCFEDSSERALPYFAADRGDMYPGLCRSLCAGYTYAGVQYSSQCFCGNSLQYGQRPASECNTPCRGNSGIACGGGWRNSIYSTGTCGWYDCAGVCNGSAVTDCAGVCNGGASDCGCGCGNACPCGGGGDVVFYWDIWYSGGSFSAGSNVDFVGWNWNDQISSIHIPAGRAVVLYQDWYYGGQSIYLTGDIPDLRDYGWNDWASSIAVY